jgi:CheY-like chemotaxis protein
MAQTAPVGRNPLPKTALVVDDSRVALLSLARLLKAQGLMVDMVESGPEALDYLRSNPPPATIFLDHMMPGMDGFETLRAIKATHATSAIPVVMYTSKEGDVYLDEVRARGAAGVLQKPAHALAVERILMSLQIFHSRDAATQQATADTQRAARSADITASVNAAPASAIVVPLASPRAHVSPAVTVEQITVGRGSAARFLGSMLFLVLLAAGVWWSFTQYRELEQTRDQLATDNARLKAAEARRLAAERPAAGVETPTSVHSPVELNPSEPSRAVLETIAWSLNQQSRFDFGEVPFNDARLQLVRELVSRLTEAGFRGTVRLEGHLGEFCIVRDEQGGNRLPAPGTLFSGCEVLTFPPGEAVRLAQRQSDAFARFLNEQAAARGPIEVSVVSHGASRPSQRYPDHATTASEWNAIARLNQRVEIALAPAAR